MRRTVELCGCGQETWEISPANVLKASYIAQLHYNECVLSQSFLRAIVFCVFYIFFGLLLNIAVTRRLLRKLVPSPGQGELLLPTLKRKYEHVLIVLLAFLQTLCDTRSGPSHEQRVRSWFKATHVALTADGQQVTTVVAGGDPGYSETAKMLSEVPLQF